MHEHSSGGPLLILAGAGSGKTAVMTRRIVYLLLRGVDPKHILAMTFTNKAGREMKNRAQKLFEQARAECSQKQRKKLKPIEEKLESEAWIGTFHSMGKRILELEEPTLGRPLIKNIRGRYSPPLRLLDPEENQQLFERAYRQRLDKTDYEAGPLRSKISEWRNQLVPPKAARKQAEGDYEKTAARLYRAYRREKFNFSPPALDFQDLLNYPARLLRDNPEVRELLQDKFRHVLVDEYQDTNHVQFLFCQHLVKDHRRLVAVGDDAQSIYGWRGAEIKNIRAFRRYFNDAKIVRLEKNYRSSVNIVLGAENIFEDDPEVYDKELTPSRGNESGLEYGKPIAVFECLSDREERGFLSHEIKRLVRHRDFNFGDIAVFYRTNRQKKPLSEHLEERGIPHVELGERSFLRRREVFLFRCLLRILEGLRLDRQDDLQDTDSYTEALQNWLGREDTEFSTAGLEKINGAVELFKILTGAERARNFKRRLGKVDRDLLKRESEFFMKLYRQLKDKATIQQIAEEYAGRLGIEYPPGDTEYSPMEFPALFTGWLEQTAEGPGVEGLSDFLEKVKQQTRDPQFVPGDPQKFVKLTTLHGAKGLEFPVVFFTGLEEGICPYIHPGSGEISEEKLGEEKRLFYVGITRAQKRLNLLWSRQRQWMGKLQSQKKSRFLELLPEDLTTSVQPPRSMWQKIKAAFVR